MALSPQEERVLAALEAQFSAGDDPEDLRPELASPSAPRAPTSRVAPAAACVLGGLALLVEARQAWFLERISFVSGFSTASIALAFTVLGFVMVVAAPLVLRGGAAFTSGTPGGSSSHPPSPGGQIRQRTLH